MSAKGQDRSPRLAALSVEPLSEVSWQRIERRLFADGAIPTRDAGAGGAPGRGGVRRRLAAGAAVVAAAAALALLLWPRADRDPVESGPPQRSRIETADAPTSVSLGDVALEVAARSALLVAGDRDGGMLLVLERGEAAFQVAPRNGRPAVVVHAGDVSIEVVGTAFTVTRVGDSARVTVHEGEIAVLQRGRRALVAAGQTWSGRDAAAITQPGPDPEPQPPPERAGAHEPGDDGQRAGARPRPSREKGTGARADAHPGTGAGPGASTGTGAPVASTGTNDEQARYERAARLEASRPASALAIYDRLARGRGPWAANALFAQARLELELGHRDRARRLLGSYLARHPRGANAEDARQLLAKLR